MLDGKSISVVMVEKDSTQRIWQCPLSGAAPFAYFLNMTQLRFMHG